MSQREFNPRTFFRRFQPEIRNRLLGQLDLLDQIKANESREDPEPDRVFFAWARASEALRNVSDRELRRINDLACDNARFYLNQKAADLWSGEPELLKQALDMTNQDLAATIFLESHSAFEAVYGEFTLDDFSFRVKRQGKRPQEVEPTPEKKALFKQGLVDFFHDNKDGDRKVQVEDHLDDIRFGLFIYHEDRLRYEDGFDDKARLVSRTRRPVGQAMAVYYPKSGLLMVKARALKLRDQLIRLIGQVYFDDVEFFATLHVHEFDLTPLNDPDFDMPFNAGDGIGAVRIVELSLAALNANVGPSTFACPNGPKAALHSLGLPLDMVVFNGVKIRVEPDGKKNTRQRTIAIELPDRWNLKDTPRDRKLAEYVDRWGLMKKEGDDEGKPVEDLVDDAERLGESLRARVAARYQGQNTDMAH